MKVLGISGFENAIPFLKSRYPGLDEREYRMSQGHDSAAALVVDGKIVAAAEEERFDRVKHSAAFPRAAMQFCLDCAGMRIEDVDVIAHGFDYGVLRPLLLKNENSAEQYEAVYAPERLQEQLLRHFPSADASRLQSISHHDAHEASAYYCSGFDECLSFVIDGMGETFGASIFHRKENACKVLKRISAVNSIGILYSLVTLHLGFDFNADEYKIMGLAPYGDPERFRAFFDREVTGTETGNLRIPLLHLNKTPEEKDRHLASRRYLDENLTPARGENEEITDAHRDVAAALQACLDRVLLDLTSFYGRQIACRKLAMAGGVALNCTANGKILKTGVFDEVFVQPVSGDDGTALGAALHVEAAARTLAPSRIPVPFYGPEPTREELRDAVERFRGRVVVEDLRSLEGVCRHAAGEIAEGNVIAWYRGRMEFGARALGHRSILGDPAHPEMRDRVNAMVKKREAFRPFAPAVAEEAAVRYFDVDPGQSFPYMIFIVDVRESQRARFPAITHVDGTARIQTVSAEGNPDFHTLLRAVGEANGVPMVLNTSFNVKGQPIVNTPEEAIQTYLGTGIDTLYLDNYHVRRSD